MSLELFDTVLGFAAVMLVLSLFVTAMVQLASAVTDLRSRNLAWGLERLLKAMDRNNALNGQAKELALAVVYAMPHLSSGTVNAPSANSGGSGGAEAIKAGELVQALRMVATQNDQLGTAVQALVRSIGGDAKVPGLSEQAAKVTEQLVKVFPAQAEAVQDAVKRGLLQADALELHTAQWFDTVMARCSQRFTDFSRWLAVLIALPVVAVLGIDAAHIFKTLRDQPLLRQSLVVMAPDLQTRAKAISDNACQYHASLALATMADATKDAATATRLRSAPKDLRDEADGLKWLSEQKLATQTALEADFKAGFAKAPVTCVERAEKQLRDLRDKELQALQPLTIDHDKWTLSNLPGQLLAWVLLTLGAPFWFNALKTLSSLRPLVAGKADKPDGQAKTG